MSTAVEALGLVKCFGPIRAVDGVDLTVGPGEVRGLLGPNGAGKTTLLRLLFGLVRPERGSVSLLGRAPADAGSLDGVGGFVEDARFYPYLSARRNLDVLTRLDGLGARRRVGEVLERVGLARDADRKVGTFSTGMRQRLGLAAALLRAPRLLLLDEPTAGLDPEGTRDMRVLLRELARDGITVLFSSHDMGEVEHVCESVTIMRSGQVVWDGTLGELRAEAPVPAHVLVTSDDARAAELARSLAGVRVEDGERGLRVSADAERLDAFVIALGQAGVAVRELEVAESPLETMFFRLTTP
jgi:ABC-2 type transport system ATP-binding protein